LTTQLNWHNGKLSCKQALRSLCLQVATLRYVNVNESDMTFPHINDHGF